MKLYLAALACGIATALSLTACGHPPKADSAPAPVPAPTSAQPATQAAPVAAAPAPIPSSEPPSPAAQLSFRQELVEKRKTIPKSPQTRIVDQWLDNLDDCLRSEDRTSGDRYLCLDTSLDQRIDLLHASPDRKLRMASSVASLFVRGKVPASASGRVLAFESLAVVRALRLEAYLPGEIEQVIRKISSSLVDESTAKVFVGETRLREEELNRLSARDASGGAQ